MTRDEEILRYETAGLITHHDAGVALGRVCPDQWSHARLYNGLETTWRKSWRQVAADYADGRCPYCGGEYPGDEAPTVAQAVAVLSALDIPPLPEGVEGVKVGHR